MIRSTQFADCFELNNTLDRPIRFIEIFFCPAEAKEVKNSKVLTALNARENPVNSDEPPSRKIFCIMREIISWKKKEVKLILLKVSWDVWYRQMVLESLPAI